MQLKDLFSIVVAILMVGSIVGFTAFYNFPDQSEPSDGNGGQQPPTAIDFMAENVQASVEQMLPSITIQAETKETDIVAINSSIYSIDGVKRVNSRFQQAPYTVLATGFVYVADLSFDPDLNTSQVLERLEKNTSLQNIAGHNFALVQLPKKVLMRSVDEALDLSREYTFSENISEALISLDSINGDQLKVTVTATFIGEEATNVMAFEEENLTAKLIPKKAVLEAQIASLEGRLLFSSEVPYSLVSGLASLEEEATAIDGIIDVNVAVPSIEPKISISGKEGVEEASFSGLEAFLNDLNAGSVSLNNNPLSGSVSFAEGAAGSLIAEKVAAIEAELSRIGIDANAEEASGFLSGQVQLSSVESKEPGGELHKLLESKGIEFELVQPGQIAAEEIFDSDSNSSYQVPSGQISAMLLLGHGIGDTVSVEVDYALVRGSIGSAQATEKN